MSVVGKVLYKVLNNIAWIKKEHCVNGVLALELIEAGWIMFSL